ncbi:MAG: hypothetical protein GXP35_05145 [Actinobacteria bacterium]|nr:hypothetical protein [Actinomycetota bacterium]
MSAKERAPRPRRLRRQIAGTMMITALIAVALFGALNYFAANQLLRSGTHDQLASVAQGRARTIETGTERLLGDVAAIAADLGVSRALEDFIEAFDELENDPLDDSQLAELEEFYENEVVSAINEVGLGPVTVGELMPATNAGRYVQYYYTLAGQDGNEPRRCRRRIVLQRSECRKCRVPRNAR